MFRFSSPWIGLLTVMLLTVNPVGVFSPGDLLVVQAPANQSSLPVLSETRTSVDDWLFEHSSSKDWRISLQEARQYKQSLLPEQAWRSGLSSSAGAKPSWDAFAPNLFSFQFFFPRKLSPPSSSDDPFLS
jgi:hypothetical protein